MLTDMQKFPLRMKDNDLLVTELYKDPSENRITALSVYLTQKASTLVCSSSAVMRDFTAIFKRFLKITFHVLSSVDVNFH